MIGRSILVSLCLSGVLAAQQAAPSEADQAAKRLRPPQGLQLDLFAAEPDFVNPVAFAFDEKGRVFVVETHRLGNCTYDIRGHMGWVDDDLACRTVADREAMHRKHLGAAYEKLTSSDRVRLLEDRDGDGRVDRATTFAEGFGTPASGIASGVLARKGDVWFANIPDLWMLRDTDGDGTAEQRSVVHTGFGVRLAFIGHDLHGLRFGPDGKLYFSIGDRGARVEKDGKLLVDNPDSGCVMRCNADGSGLEVFATGLRNPQELAFDAFGNLWTGDNNCDAGDKARWTYLMEGGDCGWRVGYQQAPGRGPWMSEKLWEMDAWRTAPSQVPPVAHVGHGPSGITFNGGIGLGEAFKDRFFFTDFPGGILTIAVKAKGAGFEVAEQKSFVGNLWATDVEIGNDGAVYILDWVNGWGMPNKGRIFRVSDPSKAADPAVLETKKLIADGMEKRSADELATLLGHGDQRVRQEAQFELAARGKASVALLSKALEGGRPQLARIHAIWALGQLASVEPLVPLLKDGDAEIRAQAAKTLGTAKHAAAFEGLLPLLQDPSARVRSFAAMALGKLGRKEAAAPILEMLRANADQDAWLRNAGVTALAGIGDVASMSSLSKDPSASVRLAALLALRRLKSSEIRVFLEDADPALVLEAARAINDAPVADAMTALAAMLQKTLPEKAWARAVNAAFRTGQAPALAAFAGRKDAPEAARAEALRALADWEKPSGRDRILHVWRPLAPRDPRVAREALGAAFDVLMKDAPNGVREAAATAAGALALAEAGPPLLEASGKNSPPSVRIAALRALVALQHEKLAGAILGALEDKDPSVRKEGARLLQQLKVPNVAALLDKLATEDGPIAVRQQAIASLGQTAGPESEKALGRLMDVLIAGKLPMALRLDVLEAASKKPSLREKLSQAESTRRKDDLLAAWRDSLEGGDAENGRKIFLEKSEVSCLKCHKVGGRGGEVGPLLDAPGPPKTREYLLESIVVPNKEITPGFAQVILLLQSDAVETGRIESETEKQLVLLLPDGTRKKIAPADVKGRKIGLSPMPEDLVKKLSAREVRDLVEFLASLHRQ